ncbi:MAG TPA: Holliday junction resolvase RuvX [Acidimicrobiales bacterium]
MIPEGRVVGVDLGSRRIGIAISDTGQSVATPVTTLRRGRTVEQDHRAIAGVVDEYGAIGTVVGVPVSLSGEVGPAAQAVLEEVDELRSRLNVEVETVDERFTTTAAAGTLRASGRDSRKQRELIDQFAAAELLQTWLERRKAPLA